MAKVYAKEFAGGTAGRRPGGRSDAAEKAEHSPRQHPPYVGPRCAYEEKTLALR